MPESKTPARRRTAAPPAAGGGRLHDIALAALTAMATAAVVLIFAPSIPSLYEFGPIDLNVSVVDAGRPDPGPDPRPDDGDDYGPLPDRSPFPSVTSRVPDWVDDVRGEPNFVRTECRTLSRVLAGSAADGGDRAELLAAAQAGIDRHFDEDRQRAWEPFNEAFAGKAKALYAARKLRTDAAWADLLTAVAIGLRDASE